MKKYIVSFILILVLSQASYSQNANQLMQEFASKKEVVNLKIRRFWVSMAKPFILTTLRGEEGDKQLAQLINGIKSVQIAALDDCNQLDKGDFIDRFHALKDSDGYETLLQVKDGKDNVRIIMKKDKNKIKELFIFCLDSKDAAMIKLSGDIKLSDVGALVEKYNKKDECRKV